MRSDMKQTVLWICLAGAVLLAAGCRTRYDVTLNSGGKIRGVTKPKLDATGRFYVFKDAAGKTNWVPAIRVNVIEPQEPLPKAKTGKVKRSRT